jgi:hypothetical protein
MASFPFINTFAMVLLREPLSGGGFFGFVDGNGYIRAHDTTHGAMDAIFRARLVNREITFRIDLGRNLENIFGTDGNAQTAAFAAVLFDIVLIRH